MKIKFLAIALTITALSLFGCAKNQTLQSSMSEITYLYFQGYNNSDEVGSISVGEREEPYRIDGVHNKTVEFSLIDIEFDEDGEEILANITINNQESNLQMYFNPLTNSYMADLGYCLQEDDKIEVAFENTVVIFENIGSSFSVNYQTALEIGQTALKDEIESMTDGKNFKGEGYLKILKNDFSNFEKLFWAFTIVGQDGNSYNVVIDVNNKDNILKK